MPDCIWCGEESPTGICDYHAPELEAARLRTEHTLAFHSRLASQILTGDKYPMRGLLTRWRGQIKRIRACLAAVRGRKLITTVKLWRGKK